MSQGRSVFAGPKTDPQLPVDAAKGLPLVTNRETGRGSKSHLPFFRSLLDDAGRFDLAVTQIIGKRLTFAELTGKVGAAASN